MKNKKTAIKKEGITKDMTFHEILEKFPEAGKVFMKHNMFCALGCPMAAQETLEQGCLAHGVNVDEILKKLNRKARSKR